MTSRPIPLLAIEMEIVTLIDNGDVLIATGADQQLALELAREYARFLMGHREKSPNGDTLSIIQNQFIRSETWLIIRRYGKMRRDAPQWERYHDRRNRVIY